MSELKQKTAKKLRKCLSYWSFMITLIGFSVGLANVWKFPYEIGRYGGGGFLLVYILCVVLIAFPLLLSELLIGRRGNSNTVFSIINICKRDKLKFPWQCIAYLGLLTALLVFSYYSVIASWVLFYITKSITGNFVEVPSEVIQHSFSALLLNGNQMLLWHSVFVFSVASVLARNLHLGLERLSKWLMPGFIALLVWLSFYANFAGDISAALQFVFSIDLASINLKMIVSALNQALFSLGLGLGILILYGSSLGKDRPFFSGGMVILISDICVAVLTAIFIFSIVFAFGMKVDVGSGLIFHTLPVAFSKLTENNILWSSLFFIFLLTAALTSAFALLEPIIIWLVERFNWNRQFSAWFIAVIAWFLGWICIASFDDSHFIYSYFGDYSLHGVFDFLILLTVDFMIPLISLLTAIFIGWHSDLVTSKTALAIGLPFVFRVWKFCIRYLVPAIIIFSLIVSIQQNFFIAGV